MSSPRLSALPSDSEWFVNLHYLSLLHSPISLMLRNGMPKTKIRREGDYRLSETEEEDDSDILRAFSR